MKGQALDVVQVEKADAQVLEMFSITGLSKALERYKWSLDKEIALLTRIAEDPDESSKDQMVAAARLRQIAERILTLRGAIQRIAARGEIPGRPGLRGEVQGTRLGAASDLEETSRLMSEMEQANNIAENAEQLLEDSNAEEAESEEAIDHDDIVGGISRTPTQSARTFDPEATAASGPDNVEFGPVEDSD